MTNPSDVSPPSPEVAPSSPSASAAKGSPAPAPPEPSSPGWLQRLWTLVVRLLILGTSLSVGWMAGLLVAQVWPSRSPNPPMQERVMRQASQTLRKVRQLPEWWQGSTAGLPNPEPGVVTAPQADSGQETAPPPLNQEVLALQQDLASLESRLAELEQQAGQSGSGDLADRLQQLAQQATTSPAAQPSSEATQTPSDPTEGAEPNTGEESAVEALPEAAGTAPAAVNDGLGRHAVAPYPEPPFPLVSHRIGLPSALLFQPDSSLLTPAGQQLLDAIVPDLRRFGSVTFLVGSHTDGNLSAAEARTLTFQQALAVQTYLAAQLEDTNGRWLAVGYGKTRPVAVGAAPGTEARNQRLEIGIVRP